MAARRVAPASPLCYGGRMISELDIGPRGRGRASKALDASMVRPLAPSDLALLASERGTASRPVARLRDRHHSLARCLARGMSNAEAAIVTGYDPSRISVLKGDPSFQELLSYYRACEDELLADFTQRATDLTLTAMDALQEAIEDEENPMAPAMILEVAKFAADRTGHAPVTKSLNVNVNADLGNRLDAARKRLRGSDDIQG